MFILTTLIAFLYELYLAIPIIGGLTVLGTGFGTVTVAFVIHGIVLLFRFVNGRSKAVPIIALLLTFLTFIPGIAWLTHTLIAIMYLIDLFVGLFASNKKNY